MEVDFTVEINGYSIEVSGYAYKHAIFKTNYISCIEKIIKISNQTGLVMRKVKPIKLIYIPELEAAGVHKRDADIININSHQSLDSKVLRSVIFHELIHFFYGYYFENVKGYRRHLNEGLATYYEHKEYNLMSEIYLLQDRMNEENPYYALGYYLFNHYHDELISFIKSKNIEHIFSEIETRIKYEEFDCLALHMEEYILCKFGFDSNYFGVIYASNLSHPYLLKLDAIENIDKFTCVPDINVIVPSDIKHILIKNPMLSETPVELWASLANALKPYKSEIDSKIYKFDY